MTNLEIDKNRQQIIREFLDTGEMLRFENLEITLSKSSELTHVFSNEKFGKLKHLYSMTGGGLEKLVNTLDIKTIKKIFIEGRVLRLRNKFLAENDESKPKVFNPLDFEGCK